MPNYVENHLVVHHPDEQVAKDILDSISSKDDGLDNAIDFNKIIPMPESLDIARSSLGDLGLKLMKLSPEEIEDWAVDTLLADDGRSVENKRQLIKEILSLGLAYYTNVLLHGYIDWYDWRCSKWGTKWNAIEPVREDVNSVTFSTAWSPPFNVILALSSQYPDATFELTFAEEQFGYWSGKLQYKNGEVVFEDQPEEYSEQCYEYYFKFYDRSDYVWDEAHKRYVDAESLEEEV